MRILAALAALAALTACNDGPSGLEPNTLDGSIRELFPDVRQVDAVRMRLIPGDVVTVEYFAGNDIVAKIAPSVKGFVKGAKVKLAGHAVDRITSPDVGNYPDVSRGEVTFDSDLDPGKAVSGCFAAVFEAGEDGTQRTLSGAFEGTLEDQTK